MHSVTITQINRDELSNLINNSLKEFFKTKGEPQKVEVSPRLTRKEVAKLFDVSLNCVNDWSKKGILKRYKVGQRTYFKRSECENVLFNQPKQY
jgi:hypothetical protein